MSISTLKQFLRVAKMCLSCSFEFVVSIFCETMKRQKIFLATLFNQTYISSSDPQIDKLCMWTCVDMCIDIYFRTLCLSLEANHEMV